MKAPSLFPTWCKAQWRESLVNTKGVGSQRPKFAHLDVRPWTSFLIEECYNNWCKVKHNTFTFIKNMANGKWQMTIHLNKMLRGWPSSIVINTIKWYNTRLTFKPWWSPSIIPKGSGYNGGNLNLSTSSNKKWKREEWRFWCRWVEWATKATTTSDGYNALNWGWVLVPLRPPYERSLC